MSAEALLPPLVLELRARAGQVHSELKGVRSDVKTTDAETSGGLSKTGKAFAGLAVVGKAALAGIAGGAVAGGVAALKLGTDFQESTTQLVTGAGESEKNIGMVRNGILAMSGQVGQVPIDLSKGMYLIESAGYHAAQGLTVLKAAAEGAKIGGADMTTVADGLTTALTDYHIPASQAATVTSQLVETVASGKTSMGALAGSLHNVLPAAAAAHLGLAQVLGAMATMTGQGISAEQASQDLANTIRSLQNPTQQQATMMEALGIKSTDLSKNLGKVGLTGTLDELTAAIAKHTKGGLIFESTLKNSESAAADAKSEFAQLPASLQPLAKQFVNGTISAKDWRKQISGLSVGQKQLAMQFAGTVNKSRGFNDLVRSGTPQAKTFAAALSTLTGGATGMNTALALTGANAATFSKNVAGIGKTSAEAGGHVKGWEETSKDLAVQLAKAKAMVIALATKIGVALIPYVEKAIHFGSQMVSWLQKHTTVAKVLAGVIGGVLATAIAAYVGKLIWAGAQSVIQFAKMVASGTVWVAQQVAGIATSLASLVAWGVEHTALAAGYIAENIAMAASATAAFIAENAATLGIVAGIAVLVAGIVWLATHWSTVWNGIKTVAQAAWNDVIKPVFGFIKTVAIDPIILELHLLETAWSAVWSGIKTVVSGAWNDVIKPVFGFIKTVAIDGLKADIKVMEVVWSAVWNGITAVVSGAWNNVIKPVFGFIAGQWNVIKSAAGAAWAFLRDDVFTPIKNGFNALSSFISNAASTIGGIFSGFWDGLKSAGATVFNWVANAWNDTLGAINFTLPSWIPGIGGDGFGFPKMPTIQGYAKGGAVGDGLFVAGEHGPELGIKSGANLSFLTAPRTNAVLSGLGSGHGDGEGPQVIENHTTITLDGEVIAHAVERKQLQKGARRGVTYQGYKR